MSSKKKSTRSPSSQNNRKTGKATRPPSPAPAPDVFSRAVQHHREGRFGEAEALYQQVLRADPRHADALHLLGVAKHQQGRHELAVGQIRQAIAVKNTEPLFYGTLGSALQSLGDRAGAMAAYQQALSLDPEYAEAHNNVGVLLKEDDRDTAKARFQQALRFRPDYPEALNNLGTVLQAEGDVEAATALYRRAIALKPDYAAAHNNLGTALQAPGDLAGAAASFQEALRLAPDFAEAHFNFSMVQLTQGDFARGWAGYKRGLKTTMRKTHPFTEPLWDGEPLAGRTLLVHAEQGFGDTFQFVRYLPLVQARWCADGSRIVFACQDGLGRVLQRAEGFDLLVESTAGAQSPPPFDVQVPLLNLPAVLGTTLDSIPGGVPYLQAEPELAARWQAQIDAVAGGDFKVGIVWAGSPGHQNDRSRSCRLADFAPLARIGGMRLLSLQKGAGARQADELGADMHLVRLDQELGDWADTAAAITGLDLVITVDTAIAHLAGALGKPVWVLLPHMGEWRWLQGREDSPWYPTMRLFRQGRPGDWAGVFERIVATLCGAADETEQLAAAPGSAGDENNLLISVVITTYNRRDILQRVLASYETQTVPLSAYEVIVIDDASTDGTDEFLQGYAPNYHLVRYRNERNRGLAASRNEGLLRAQAPLVLFADDDDAATPRFLEENLRTHAAYPAENVAVLGKLEASPEVADSVVFHVMTRNPGLYIYTDDLRDGQVCDFRHFWGGRISVKKSFLLRCGLFDGETRGAEDAELGWRLHRHGLQVVFNERAVLRALRSYSYDQFCRRSFQIGQYAAWITRKHKDNFVLFWFKVASAEAQRAQAEKDWSILRDKAEQITVLEQVGWGPLRALEDFDTIFAGLTSLCRAGLDYHYLAGYLQKRSEYEAADRNTLPTSGPPVSVVIPCYNYALYLPEAVESVITQTYRSWEILIVNDGSTDNTREVAERLIAEHPEHRIRLINQENSGQPAIARNRGIEEAGGQYILPLDADDRIGPTMLAECVRLLEENPGISIAYTDQEHFDDNGSRKVVHAPDYDLRQLAVYNLLGVCSLYRRQAWVDAGGYRTNVKGYEDWDFWIACGEKGHHGRRIPQPLFRYRQHGTGLYAVASQRDTCLRAQVVLNHPALYDASARRWASGVKAADDWMAERHARVQKPPAALVSVIVPTYNRPQMLVEALKSIRAQTYQNFEIIVVNDAGPDVSAYIEPLNPDGKIRLINKERNRGLADSRNVGIRAARGKYIAYLDDDDLFYPDHLETLVTFLENTPYQVAYTDALRAHQTLRGGVYEVTHRDQPYSFDFDYDRILLGNFVPVLCFMHEKTCVEQAGFFDATLTSHEDWDLWIRMSRRFDFVHLKQTTCDFSWRQDGSTMTSAGQSDYQRTTAAIYRKYRHLALDRPQVLAAQEDWLRRTGSAAADPAPATCEKTAPSAAARLDVLVVVHNQPGYVKACIESLYRHTESFRLLLWDNGSDGETRRYLEEIARRKNVVLRRSEENLGFIVPNNRLAEQGSAPYLALLNSDTEVRAGWDRALIDHLQAHPDVAEVGYGGGLLGPDAVGCGSGTGYDIDYIGGWCACLPRWVYEKFGLFDEENLHFAYGEDSDLSLRLKEAGYKVYALGESLVLHHGNKTILEVAQARDTSATFRANHEYLRRRWAKYLRDERVLAPKTSELERLMNRGKELAAARRAA